MIRVFGSVFAGAGQIGDFTWMIKQPEYSRSLFIFNDNEEQFDAFMAGDRASGCSRGGGNAAIRPYQCTNPRRAAGVPTGSKGKGYRSLNADARQKIDLAIQEIINLIETGSYDRVFLSEDANRPTLGTGIFSVGDDVRDYIYESIMSLGG